MYIFITDSDYSCTDKSFEYLLGFQPSLGGMIFDDKNLFVILDSRYFEKAKNIDEDRIKKILKNNALKINFIESRDIISSIQKIVQKNNPKKLFCQGCVAVSYINKIEEKLGIKINILEKDFFEEARPVKTKQEVEKMKKAISIIDKVFEYIQILNKSGKLIGKTELEVRGIIISKIFEFAGEGESFDSIVAFGKNSAIPHHSSGDTVIGNGVLLIDMGAKYKGYCSDFTRTFWVGEKTKQYKKFKKVYKIVKESHENAFKNTKPKMTGKQIDALARDIIEKEGFGNYFIHSTGHGIGLDIHEKPFISGKSSDIIKNNMFFTIEPGIYLPQEFGVRLEDIVFMEEGKLRKFSNIKI